MGWVGGRFWRSSPGSCALNLHPGLGASARAASRKGWRLSEARLDPVNAGNNSPPAPVSYPHWRGEPLDGKSILIWIEQVWATRSTMARYAAVLKARGASLVSLFCRPALEPLFKSLPGVDAVYPTAGSISLPQHDYWVYPMSLPRLCGARSDATAWSGAYLTPSDEARGQWSDPKPKRFAVGLVWSGKAAHVNDAHRSLPSVRPSRRCGACPRPNSTVCRRIAALATIPPAISRWRTWDRA